MDYALTPSSGRSYFFIDGLPCHIKRKEGSYIAEKYIPQKGFVPISIATLLLEGHPITKAVFHDALQRLMKIQE